MSNWTQAHRRLLTSARILKAYYESKLQMDVELLTEAPVPVLDHDVSFVPSVTGYGLWGLRPSKPITSEIQAEIAQMCEAILGGMEELELKRDALEKLQQHMERALNGEMPSNVINLNRRQINRPSRNQDSGRIVMLKSDCLIEAKDQDEIRKMAMEIHSQSSRVAFVDFYDLDVRIRQSLSQLISLGPITLYVADILKLSLYEQEILRHLMNHPPLQRPLLMVGSVIPYSELRVQPEIDEEFLTLLARAYIKLTRPFSEYKEQGLIHYFLDSLSSDPS